MEIHNIPGTDFHIQNITNFSVLTKEEKKKIALCYITIFNESEWEGGWTIKKALVEMEENLSLQSGCKPILSLLKKDNQTIGFAWGTLTAKEHLSTNDMPFGLDKAKKVEGIKKSIYWLNIVKQDKILVFREIAILKKYRDRMVPFLARFIFKSAINDGCEALILWTNPKTAVFSLGLGLGWTPIHFFHEDDRVLMGGGTRFSLSVVETGISGDIKEGWKKFIERINRFFF